VCACDHQPTTIRARVAVDVTAHHTIGANIVGHRIAIVAVDNIAKAVIVHLRKQTGSYEMNMEEEPRRGGGGGGGGEGEGKEREGDREKERGKERRQI
jgi:hypothetical protein